MIMLRLIGWLIHYLLLWPWRLAGLFVKYPDLSRLYRFPFNVFNAPNVVVEPTAACNLRCVDCYRGSNLPDKQHAVMTLPEIKKYVDDALALRNFHTLSILGGEPLLYDQLDEVIAYAAGKCASVGMYTNGVLLDEQRARKLKAAGLGSCYIHVDRHQGRGSDEDQIMRLRQQYCDMFRALGGVNLSLGVTFHPDDVRYLDQMVSLTRQNADVVKVVGLSLVGASYLPRSTQLSTFIHFLKESDQVDLFQRRMIKRIQEAFGVEYSAYLGSKYRPKVPGKIVALSAYRQGKLLGSMTAEEFKAATDAYYQEHGKYPYVLSREGFSAIGSHCRRFGDHVDWQLVAVSLSPLLLPELAVNICHMCMDCVLYQGHFVPMCVLEHVKQDNPVVLNSVRYW